MDAYFQELKQMEEDEKMAREIARQERLEHLKRIKLEKKERERIKKEEKKEQERLAKLRREEE